MFRALILFLPQLVLPAQVSAPPRAILEGDIVDAATNAPLAGARVKLDQGQNEPIYARADRRGHFFINNLPPVTYNLTVESPGFLQSSRTSVNLTLPRPIPGGGFLRGVIGYPPSKVPSATLTKSTDEDGTIHVKATVPLLAYAVISGKVTDPYGVAMVDCEVEVLTEQPASSPAFPQPTRNSVLIGNRQVVYHQQARTNDKGEFRFARLEPGTYWVAVTTPSGGLRSTWEATFRATYFPAAVDPASAKALELTAGQQLHADIQIVRQAGVRVSGRLVKPADHKPGGMEYTSIVLEQRESAVLNSQRPFTNTVGDQWELKDVPPGAYVLTALTSDASDNPLSADHKPVLGYRKPIIVGDKDMSSDITLEPLRDLSGFVTFAQGCSPSPIRIQLQGFNPLGGRQVEATSGPDGKFVLTGIGPGKWTVFITDPSSPGLRIPVASVKLGERDAVKEGFEVPYSGVDPLLVKLDCYASGRVR